MSCADNIEDYVLTRYIAEFVNTLTSLAYSTQSIRLTLSMHLSKHSCTLVGYGLLGVYRHKRQSVSPLTTVNLPYWGLTGIGIFSGLYHSTMKYHTQMGSLQYKFDGPREADQTSKPTKCQCT